jgi:hypothetical protein
MKKYYLLFGIVTIGILLVGSLPVLVVAQDDFMESFPFPGTYDVSVDISLDNIWDTGPSPFTPTGMTNTNLRYAVTDMISPLDEYFNAGFFGGDPAEYTGPLFAIDGDFIGSELFVKIANDQGTQIDWQAALILGKNITISWMMQEEPVDAPQELLDLLDMLPENFTIVEGTATPAFPVVKSTTNFSDFFDYQELLYDYGYHGLPFFTPGIFYLDNVYDAYEFWTNEVNLTQMFPGPDPEYNPDEYQNVDVSTFYGGSPAYTTLQLDFEWGNTTSGDVYGNASVWFNWDETSGLLDGFWAEAYPDLDESGTLDANEQFYIELWLDTTEQADIPVDVGDSGKYLLDIELSAVVSDYENATAQDMINTMISSITDPINEELDGIHLLNYTVDAIDGLYYHVDGYLFDLGTYVMDRFGWLFGSEPTSGIGAQEPLPPVESYYISLTEMGGDPGQRQDTSDFAINLFDAMTYMNTTEWLQGDGDYQPKTYFNYTSTIDETNTTHLESGDVKPGVVDAWVFNATDWWNTWDQTTESFEDHFNEMLGSEVHHGLPEYIESECSWYECWEENCTQVWNEDLQDFEKECDWACEEVTGTCISSWFINSSGPFEMHPIQKDTSYYVVYKIKEMPETTYTTYVPQMSPYMSLGFLFNMGNGGMAGIGAQEEPSNILGMQLQSIIPMPIRTPDWDVTGGIVIFLDGYMSQVIDFITSPDFIAYLESMVMETGDPGDKLALNSIDLAFDWINNGTHAGLETYEAVNADLADNDTENRTFTEAHIEFYEETFYLWDASGSLNSVGLVYDLLLNYDSEPWPEPLIETTTEPTTEPETTTTTTEPELSPGFEVLFALSTLVVLPIFYKKKRR